MKKFELGTRGNGFTHGYWIRAGGNAAEIIYQDDIVQNVVTKDVLVRTADNIIVLMDASNSMAFDNRKYKKSNYVLEKDALATGSSRLPDLGYNVGIYTHSPSWQEIYPWGNSTL